MKKKLKKKSKKGKAKKCSDDIYNKYGSGAGPATSTNDDFGDGSGSEAGSDSGFGSNNIDPENLASLLDSILDKERAYYMNEYGDPTKFKFDIEHININMGPRYLIPKSLDIIISKLNNLMSELININNSVIIKIQQFQDVKETYEFIIENEDDTLGNIIQSYVHNKYVRESNSIDNIYCKFIGYICPHPLKSIMIIRITLDNVEDRNMFISFMEKVCKEIIEDIVSIKTKWNKFALNNNIS